MPEKHEVIAKLPTPVEMSQLTQMSRNTQACRLAGFLIREDKDAIYIADPHGTWMLPHDSYEGLTEWAGGKSAPDALLSLGKPVQVLLKEGGLIHELRPWRIRRGGDPIEQRKWRLAVQKVFSLDAGEVPITERTRVGERELTMLEEVFGRRLGFDPTKNIADQVFAEHHPRSATWHCESDGGGW